MGAWGILARAESAEATAVSAPIAAPPVRRYDASRATQAPTKAPAPAGVDDEPAAFDERFNAIVICDIDPALPDMDANISDIGGGNFAQVAVRDGQVQFWVEKPAGEKFLTIPGWGGYRLGYSGAEQARDGQCDAVAREERVVALHGRVEHEGRPAVGAGVRVCGQVLPGRSGPCGEFSAEVLVPVDVTSCDVVACRKNGLAERCAAPLSVPLAEGDTELPDDIVIDAPDVPRWEIWDDAFLARRRLPPIDEYLQLVARGFQSKLCDPETPVESRLGLLMAIQAGQPLPGTLERMIEDGCIPGGVDQEIARIEDELATLDCR
ncbi:MAG: hypothetical protein ABIO70_27200 [Pseudomonadota bacterium]